MRKNVLSLFALIAIFFASCQKNEHAANATPPADPVSSQAMNAPALSLGEKHNIVCLAYWRKYGFHQEKCSVIDERIVELYDSIFGTNAAALGAAKKLTDCFVEAGLVDDAGYFKPDGSATIAASYEPNASLKAALLDIVASSGHGAANISWAKARIAQANITDPEVKRRADAFMDIYIHSSNLDYNEAYGGGFERADAAGYTAGVIFLASRVGANVHDDWIDLPIRWSISNSIKNASCYEM